MSTARSGKASDACLRRAGRQHGLLIAGRRCRRWDGHMEWRARYRCGESHVLVFIPTHSPSCALQYTARTLSYQHAPDDAFHDHIVIVMMQVISDYQIWTARPKSGTAVACGQRTTFPEINTYIVFSAFPGKRRLSKPVAPEISW